ncbi:hypothetical protein [Singulisphaera acidiphila]|uniref:hypothetical protein n=1 Tax=Singulisphaera acidiphila TaxID=466153 RepID=UPI0012FC9577|nr:hypothetical protein [Singulisphaera acidiphila]
MTAAHEVCHYLFGVVDEYNFPHGCPSSNPGGPGCLMDNYLSQGNRHGWYGRFCSSIDHAPDPAQRQSCQEIVDKFFRDRNVTTNGTADEGASNASTSAATIATTAVDNRKSKIDNITRAAMGKLREEYQAKLKGKKGGTSLTSITSLRGQVEKFLKSQLSQNQVELSKDEHKELIEGVLKNTASMVKLAIPPRFDPLVELIGTFAKNRAKELRDASPKDNESTRKRKIVQGLYAFLSGLSGTANAPTITEKWTSEERQYLEHIAMQAATMSEEKRINEDLYQAALKHIQLDRETAGTVVDIAGELGVVGIESRLAALGEVDADLRLFIPGRTASTGFGRRRTIIIDPDPLDPSQDFVFCLSGIYRYTDLRDQYVDLFSKLVERAKIELLTTEIQKIRLEERRKMLAKPTYNRSRDAQLRRLAELADRNKVRAQRETELRATISELGQQIRRNRLENIVFLIPPGGLPRDIGVLFEGLRRQLIVQGDVRLDIVMVGPDFVPPELRDIAIGSGGSISTIADVDEVGALAQRLKNDQASGAWVILPHQDEIRGPRADIESTKHRKSQRWLINGTQSGKLVGAPIEFPYLDLQSRLARMHQYFNNELAPCPSEGRLEQTNKFEYDLNQAGILAPEAITLLRTAVNQALDGTKINIDQEELGQDQSTDKGLADECEILYKTIQRYNDRNPGMGSGVEMKSTIVEHVIRARGYLEDLKSSLNIALAAHSGFLAPDYDEDRILQDAYQRFGSAYQRFSADPRRIEDLKKVLNQDEGSLGIFLKEELTETDLFVVHKQNVEQAVPVHKQNEENNAINKSKFLEQLEALTLSRPGLPPASTDNTDATKSRKKNNSAKMMEERFQSMLKRSKKSEASEVNQDIHTLIKVVVPQEISRIDDDFRVNYPEKIRIDLILANFEHEAQKRRVVSIPEPLKSAPSPNCDAQPSARSTTTNKKKSEAETDRDSAIADYVNTVRKPAAPTLAYIALKKQMVRLRAVEEFLDHIERDLFESNDKPLAGRIDRRALVLAMERMQDAEPGVVDKATGRIKHHPLAPVDTFTIENGVEKRKPGTFRLPRFYAENILFDPKKQIQAEFELIVGFSKPLPGVDLSALRENKTEVLPDLKLYNDNGQLVNTPTLRLDRDLSSPTCLVYHFSPEFKEEGWYTGALILKDQTYRSIMSDVINFTFSVASTRPNFRLNSALVQLPNDPELIPPPPNRGLSRVMDRRAKIEVQVYGGTSVLGAAIRGVLYKISDGTEQINPIGQTFYDDGVTAGDRTKGDGVYTTIIPLDQIERGMEYRVLIQAESTENSRNIPPENPNVNDDKRREAAIAQGIKTIRLDPADKIPDPEPEPAVIFQRASSIQIRVER